MASLGDRLSLQDSLRQQFPEPSKLHAREKNRERSATVASATTLVPPRSCHHARATVARATVARATVARATTLVAPCSCHRAGATMLVPLLIVPLMIVPLLIVWQGSRTVVASYTALTNT